MKLFKFFILFLLSLNVLSVEVEFVARANSYGSYNLPDSSYIVNSTIKNSQKGSIAFNFTTVVDEEARMGVWIRNEHFPTGHTLYIAERDNYMSDPSFNDRGDMVFSVYNELAFVGLYVYDHEKNKLTLALDNSLGNISSLREPEMNNSGIILFRLTFESGEKVIATLKNHKINTVVSSKHQGIAYLFGASFFNGDKVVLKVREGDSLSEAQPDSIRVYRGNEAFSRINSDVDLDRNSMFSAFNNTIAGHFSSRYIAFIAKLTNGKRVLVRQFENDVEIIATEGEGLVSTLEYFSPSINKQGNIAFRAINAKGKRGVFFYDGLVAREVLSEGELVFSDQSTAVIHSKTGPAFGGGVTINKSNEIVLQARIYTKYLETALGAAVLKITP